MRSHYSQLLPRIIKKDLRAPCRYRVIAIGLDNRNRLIDITTNTPYLQSRGRHAEERLIHRSPPNLRKVLIARVGATGLFLPIDPCCNCQRLARKYNVTIERWVA